MKKLSMFFVSILLSNCAITKVPHTEHVIKYFEGFNESKYSKINEVISDSLIITEGDYIMNFTPESYYEHFKWDSVFNPTYKILEFENRGGEINTTVSVKSSRFKFLENNPLTCKRKFHFKNGKINKIENLDCSNANWEKWQNNRDSLVKWIKINHPELDGFIYDITEKGAQDYLKAIELYQTQKLE